MWKSIFFGELLHISIEGHLSLVISSYLNINKPLYSTNGEIIANFIAYLSSFISIILLPALFIYLLTRDVQLFKTKSFERKWGALY